MKNGITSFIGVGQYKSIESEINVRININIWFVLSWYEITLEIAI